MPSQVPVYQSRLTPERIREVAPADSASIYKSAAKQAEYQGRQYEERAFENSYINAQTVATKGVQDIAAKYPADPERLQTALSEFEEGFLENQNDQEISVRLKAQIQRNGMVEVAKAKDRRQTIIDDNARYGTFLALDKLQTDMSKTSVDMFNPNPEVRMAASRAMQENMFRGQTLLNQRSADGTPLVSGAQRAQYEMGMRDQAYITAAQGWYQSQPNKLAAASAWLEGKVSFDLPNEDGTVTTVNLRDTMPASAINKADSNIMGMLRDQIAIENQAFAMEQRVNEQKATSVFTADSLAMQESDPTKRLTLDQLDSNRNTYLAGGRLNEYLALRRQLISGEPDVEDGGLKSQIYTLAMAGDDGANVLAINGAQNGTIKWQTVQDVNSVLSKIKGSVADNTLDFYSQQLKNVLTPEGAVIDIQRGQQLSTASVDMALQYQQMTKNLARQPTLAEFKPIYDQIVGKSSILRPEEALGGGAPGYIPNYLSIQPPTKQQDISDAFNMIRQNYEKKYQGQPNMQDMIQGDPEYLQDLKWHKQWKAQFNATGGVSGP